MRQAPQHARWERAPTRGIRERRSAQPARHSAARRECDAPRTEDPKANAPESGRDRTAAWRAPSPPRQLRPARGGPPGRTEAGGRRQRA
eukprot:7470348-Alexandrium_andersonii.AAC.1